MDYKPSFRNSLHTDVKPSYLMHVMTEEEIDKKKFGLPKTKKYPMPDADHVRSAVKFFNYVTPSNEKELARNILARIDEYGMDINGINIGDNNRFKKYIQHDVLMHHGIKGQRWGVRRYRNQNGSLTPAGIIRYHRNKHLINKKIKNNNETLDNNRKMVRNEEKALKRMMGQKEETLKMLKEMGYDDLSTNTVDAVLNEQKRYIKFGKELIKNVELENKKLSEIDFNAKSYKETKKMVDDMITEHAYESLKSINSYYTSKEYNTYLNYGGKPRSVGVSAV